MPTSALRDTLQRVCALQRAYSSENTAEMQARGRLIRDKLPSNIMVFEHELRVAMGSAGADFACQGRDGTGRKTIIPWTRYFSRSRSPNPQTGWYCVYLFDASGEGVYLALSHGSTDYIDGEFRPKPADRVAKLVNWARTILRGEIAKRPELAVPIKFGARKLGDAYQSSTVLAKYYDVGNMPTDADLRADAIQFAGFLADLYAAGDIGRMPEKYRLKLLKY